MRTIDDYFKQGYELGLVNNVQYIEHTIYKSVEEALEATETKIKHPGITANDIAHEKGKAKAYREHLGREANDD